MQSTVDIELDLCGLTCPLPLLKTKQSLNKLLAGQVVKVIATDPGSERDFQIFMQQSGNHLLDFEKEEGKFFYWIQKA
ncbi:MAG: sulfurtransferase TusA family protein [Gammaproteobacteria bacterium]|jgi:TusA-related sulfurtransferase|nr:sulfurtransferase TusA family protein [Gammaproteobacteria bacterium]MBT6043482.1 sulfurtransferase TusA family protein [Gammaproteobacteria bacterium]